MRVNQDARQRLLATNDVECNELSAQVQSGDRTITLATNRERAPNIINVIASTRPSDGVFYKKHRGFDQRGFAGVGVGVRAGRR